MVILVMMVAMVAMRCSTSGDFLEPHGSVRLCEDTGAVAAAVAQLEKFREEPMCINHIVGFV